MGPTERKALTAHGAEHLVLIDSISPRRAHGGTRHRSRADGSDGMERTDRIATCAKIGSLDYGLTVSVHAHAAGFIDFEPELERLLEEIDPSILKICLILAIIRMLDLILWVSCAVM